MQKIYKNLRQWLICCCCLVASIAVYADIEIVSVAPESAVGAADGRVVVRAIGSAGPFDFTIVGVSGDATGYTRTLENNNIAFFENLRGGNYEVTVENAYGCGLLLETTINSCLGEISAALSIENACLNDGSIRILSVNNAQAPYNLLWSNGESSNIISNLSPGFYGLTITDAYGCKFINEYEIRGTIEIQSEINRPCEGNNDGSITLFPSVDNPSPVNFSYLWSNGETTDYLENISAGTYSVTITANNFECEIEKSFLIEETTNSDLPSLESIVVNPTCEGQHNGRVAIRILGSFPFTVVWSNNQTSQTDYQADISNLSLGSYNVSITDRCGNTVEELFEIDEYDVFNINFSPFNCSNPGGMSAEVINGNYPPYRYVWDEGTIGQNIENINAGTYCVTVTDNLGCTASDCVFFNPIIIESHIINTCGEGNAFGIIDLQSISGSNPPYDILWENNETTARIDHLNKGNYSVTITDSNGCPAYYDFQVNEDTDTYSFEDDGCSTRSSFCDGELVDERELGTGIGYAFYNLGQCSETEVCENGLLLNRIFVPADNIEVAVVDIGLCQVSFDCPFSNNNFRQTLNFETNEGGCDFIRKFDGCFRKTHCKWGGVSDEFLRSCTCQALNDEPNDNTFLISNSSTLPVITMGYNREKTNAFIQRWYQEVDLYEKGWTTTLSSNNKITGVGIQNNQNNDIFSVGTFSNELTYDNQTIIGQGGTDIYFNKLDSLGQIIWFKTIKGALDEKVEEFAIDEEGSLVLTGSFEGQTDFGSNTLSSNAKDGFVVKYNTQGNLEWTQQIGGAQNNISRSLSIDESNNIYIAGSFKGNLDLGTYHLSAQSNDFFIGKLSPSSQVLWLKTLRSETSLESIHIATSKTGQTFVSGLFQGSLHIENSSNPINLSTNTSAAFLSSYDTNGNLLWAKKIIEAKPQQNLNQDSIIIVNDLKVFQDNSVLVAGNFEKDVIYNNLIEDTSRGGSDIFLAKFNSSGEVIWIRKEGISNNEVCTSIDVNDLGYISLTGYYYDSTYINEVPLAKVPNQNNGFVIAFNENENMLNCVYSYYSIDENIIPPENYQAASFLSVKGIVEAETNVTLKAGNQIHFQPGFHAQAESYVHAAIEEAEDCDDSNSYQPSVEDRAAVETPLPIPTTAALRCYPNPFQQSTTIEYQLPQSTTVDIALYGMRGEKMVQLLSNQVLEAGQHSINYQASSLPSGIYYLVLRAGKEVLTEKLVVMGR